MTAVFDHRDLGTSESAWLAGRLDDLPEVFASGVSLVVLAAHPDDESLGAAGLIAASARAGADITVLVATDGEGSHPGSPSHSPSRLADLRRREVHAAVAHLAPDAIVRRLGLPDGALRDHRPSLEAALRAAIGARPVRLVTPWRGDGHPDHQACAEAAEGVAADFAVELWQYPIWAWHWADPSGTDLPRNEMRRLVLTDADVAAKRRALDEHRSQHRPLSPAPGDEPVLPAHVLAHFTRPYECFLPRSTDAPAARRSYFDALYATSPDPWGLADRFYEKRKRNLLMASLPRARFRRVFEPGCATGLLTARLLDRADEVVAWDVAQSALEQTARRLEETSRARVGSGRIPADWPEGAFDLVVLSEVGYYCEDIDALVRRVLDSLTDDGVVVACHWTQAAPDHPQRASDVHDALGGVLSRIVAHVEDDFVLDVWTRTGTSVAAAEGIV